MTTIIKAINAFYEFKYSPSILGEGLFGTVYLAVSKSTRKKVAWSVAPKLQAKQSEIEISQANMRAIEVLEDFETVFFSFPLMSSQTLEFVIELERAKGILTEECSAGVIIQIQAPRSEGILHNDMKPDNVLVDKNGTLKITDFGCSVYASDGHHHQDVAS